MSRSMVDFLRENCRLQIEAGNNSSPRHLQFSKSKFFKNPLIVQISLQNSLLFQGCSDPIEAAIPPADYRIRENAFAKD
ncbi:hypothetical protein V6N13_014329 [Hibiscus sabdariffa]|uniref:Uncharacterized protein n=1 Tax=Hibiscus sabdariffa TaxID=183260 RepID=A0ABR2RVT5_9ROSI